MPRDEQSGKDERPPDDSPSTIELKDLARLLNRKTLATVSALCLLIAPLMYWASTRNEAIVAWALREGHASESATRWLPGLIHDGGLALTAILTFFGLPAVLWGMRLLYRYPWVGGPIDLVLNALAPIFRPFVALRGLTSHLLRTAYGHVVAAAGWLAASALGALRLLVLLIRGIGQAATALVALVVFGAYLLFVRLIGRPIAIAASLVRACSLRTWQVLAHIGLTIRDRILTPLATSLLSAVSLAAGATRTIAAQLRHLFARFLKTLLSFARALLRPVVLGARTLASGARRNAGLVWAKIVLLGGVLGSCARTGLRLTGTAFRLVAGTLVSGARALMSIVAATATRLARVLEVCLAASLRALIAGDAAIARPVVTAGGVAWRAVRHVSALIGAGAAATVKALALAASTLANAFAVIAALMWRGVCYVFTSVKTGLVVALRSLGLSAQAVLHPVVISAGTCWRFAGRVLESIPGYLAALARGVWTIVSGAVAALLAFLSTLIQLLVVPLAAGVQKVARTAASIWAGLTKVLIKGHYLLARAGAAVMALVRSGLLSLARYIVSVVTAIARPFMAAGRLIASTLVSYGRGVMSAGAVAVRAGGRLSRRVAAVTAGFASSYWQGLVVAGRAIGRAMTLAVRVGAVVVGAGFVFLLLYAGYGLLNPEPTVTVVHWTTGHLLRDGSGLRLLRQMADEFNEAGYRSPDGHLVRVEVHYAGGSDQAPELISRLTTNTVINKELPDPTLVTPSASHWLVNVNYAAGREVFDLRDTDSRSLARTYVGIVTYRAMAECLGWPERAIGYAEIIALKADPEGWARYDCAQLEWGQRPLFAFTDPATSDTGRAVLLSLYAIAAEKAPEDLTVADLQRPEVIDFVRSFQGLVDHYMPATIPLNTKVCEGPRYGHFFLMPEDNLAHLMDGTEECLINGVEQNAPPLQEPMVIAYPHEGSLLRDNCACAVKAPWVSEEEAAATELWISFLREDRQQHSFAAAGFRPGTDLELPASSLHFGAAPENVLHAERIHPEVAAAIDASWNLVKRPAVVTFVADTSGSMLGNKLRKEKDGLLLAIQDMAPNNWVGLISFDDTVRPIVDIAPVAQNRLAAEAAVREMRAGGETALYEAIKAAILMTDGAQAEPDAIRAVVVITDGLANRGTTCLDELVSMTSSREVAVSSYCGFAEDIAMDVGGSTVSKSDLRGTSLAISTQHPVQVFFVAIGEDADLDIGRIFAGATGAEFRGATEADLAEVIEEFGRYF